MSKNLDGDVVLVTGGAAGVGKALALEAARRGANVVLADIADAEPTVAELRALGGSAEWIRTDMRNFADAEAAVSFAQDRFGRLNVLCNNAGMGVGGGLHEVDPEQAKAVLDLNVLGLFHGIRAAAAALIASAAAGQSAYLLNTGSEHSLGVPPYVTPISIYTASKYAALGLTDTARRDLGPLGVSVSLLAPGWVLTENVQNFIKASPEFAAAVSPYAQKASTVARLAFDGLLAGRHVILTNGASQEFARERLAALSRDIDALPSTSQ